MAAKPMKKMVEKFELCFNAYDSRDPGATPSREICFVFERVGKTSNYKACFVLRNTETGLYVNLPLSEGNYEKLCDLFEGIDANTAEGYFKRCMTMFAFIPI